jgi:hypothetical protein
VALRLIWRISKHLPIGWLAQQFEKPEEIANLRSGKDALYFYGTLFYETEFGDEVEIDFCQLVDATGYVLWEASEEDAAFGWIPLGRRY